MKLHNDNRLFIDSIRATSQFLQINEVFIEKDYWITYILRNLSQSRFADQTVFKGGTSLSKGFRLIDRFSEDVDIAIIDENNKSGYKIKGIIRATEKEMTGELKEIVIEGVSSKGSKFRKSVFNYLSIDKKNQNNKLIIEVNSFANPFPFSKIKINSMIYDFFIETKNIRYIEEYNLQPFSLNILNKEQTLIEKLVSLIRFSLGQSPVIMLSSKIRHFYDLFYLMKDSECKEYVASNDFKIQFTKIMNNDREIFSEPEGWQNKPLESSPLINDFGSIWSKIKTVYQIELSALAFKKIPDEKEIASNFELILKYLK